VRAYFARDVLFWLVGADIPGMDEKTVAGRFCGFLAVFWCVVPVGMFCGWCILCPEWQTGVIYMFTLTPPMPLVFKYLKKNFNTKIDTEGGGSI
jgi:hypothetical protein